MRRIYERWLLALHGSTVSPSTLPACKLVRQLCLDKLFNRRQQQTVYMVLWAGCWLCTAPLCFFSSMLASKLVSIPSLKARKREERPIDLGDQQHRELLAWLLVF